MKYNVSCPVCRALLSKSGNGTNSEVTCHKCKSLLSVEVVDSQVKIDILKASTKQKKVRKTA